MRQASGLNVEIVDRAAELCAKPKAIKDLVDAMATLSNSFHEVNSMLNEIQELLQVVLLLILLYLHFVIILTLLY